MIQPPDPRPGNSAGIALGTLSVSIAGVSVGLGLAGRKPAAAPQTGGAVGSHHRGHDQRRRAVRGERRSSVPALGYTGAFANVILTVAGSLIVHL
jgi:hypothetical protein